VAGSIARTNHQGGNNQIANTSEKMVQNACGVLSHRNYVMKETRLNRSPHAVAYNVVHDDSAARGGPVAIEIKRRIGAVRGGAQGVLFVNCKALKPLVDAFRAT
jgi:hypothetical protein